MTSKTICEEMATLKKVFDVVRLVDTTITTVFSLSEDGTICEEEYSCFDVWQKNRRCENCISSKAFACKNELTKFEFRGDQVYFIMAKYIELDGAPYTLEMGKLITDKTLFGAYGKNEFIEKLTAYNSKIYTDSLTGCYNRRFFDEQLVGLNNIAAIAVVDIDDFKKVNDEFGHRGGDEALKVIAEVLTDNLHVHDSVIRLGGDEFVLAFNEMDEDLLKVKLETLRKEIEATEVTGFPKLKITVSIGGCCCEQYNDRVFTLADRKMYEAKKRKNTVVIG